MATNWKTPVGVDVLKVIGHVLAAPLRQGDSPTGSNENIGVDSTLGQEFDPALANRRDELMTLAIQTVRSNIQSAGRIPLSVTANAVPPDMEIHVLSWVAWRLINSNINLQSRLSGEGSNPFKEAYDEACKRFDKLATGDNCISPTDPTGEDYLTAVSSSNPAISSIKWGDSLANDTEYDAGITAAGVVVSTFSQNMNTQ
jgi:hypothetical protein